MVKLLVVPCWLSWQYLKLYGRLIIMSAKPYELPNSKILLLCLSFIYMAVCFGQVLLISDLLVANADEANPLVPLKLRHAGAISFVSLALLWGAVSLVFAIHKLRARIVRVLGALLGVEIIFSTAFSLLALMFSPFAALAMIIILYWQFMVYIYIFSQSLNDNALVAGIFALAYILLQHNTIELMLSTFMRVN